MLALTQVGQLQGAMQYTVVNERVLIPNINSYCDHKKHRTAAILTV